MEDSLTFCFFGVRGRPGVRSRQSDHVNASMNCEAYAAVQSGFLKVVLGGIASVRSGAVLCAMVRGGALQCGALLWLLHVRAQLCLAVPSFGTLAIRGASCGYFLAACAGAGRGPGLPPVSQPLWQAPPPPIPYPYPYKTGY